MGKFGQRATNIFGQAWEKIQEDCKTMHANHSAQGTLRSGNTIKCAIDIYEEHMCKALDQILKETAKIIEHRGKKWSAAMSEIGAVLDAETSKASEILEPSFRLAARHTENITNPLITRVNDNLRAKLSEFEEGWTAPLAKRYPERHPIIYAILLLIIGAALPYVFSIISN